MKTDLVLLPGLLCDARLFATQVNDLVDVADVYIPDLVQNSIVGMARDVLAKAPDRFALAGLSMGGYVAQEIMRQAPERVSKFCLMSTTARPDAPEQSKMRNDLIRLARSERFGMVMPRLLPKLISAGRRGDQKLRDIVVDMSDAIGPEIFIQQQQAIIGRPDGLNDLRKITVPTTIICGDADELTPPDRHSEMAERIPGASMTIIAGSGHLLPLEAPEETTRALRDWLLA